MLISVWLYLRKHYTMAKPCQPLDYLSERGRKIFFQIRKHIEDNGIMLNIDEYELSMLAQSFDLFDIAATYCKDNGITGEFNGKNGTFKQVIPEYNVMQQQYDKVLKHSSKFGLNPGDRAKIFGGLKKKERKSVTSDLD